MPAQKLLRGSERRERLAGGRIPGRLAGIDALESYHRLMQIHRDRVAGDEFTDISGEIAARSHGDKRG